MTRQAIVLAKAAPGRQMLSKQPARSLNSRRAALTPPPCGVTYVDRRDGSRRAASAPANASALPAGLRATLEQLSGVDLTDVSVHRGSSRPAALGAAAFTQGSEIHIGPGQDQHLAHEAWHVVQQKQGRVRPNGSAYGALVNQDPSLEAEADHMGARATREGGTVSPARSEVGLAQGDAAAPASRVVQLKPGPGGGMIRRPLQWGTLHRYHYPEPFTPKTKKKKKKTFHAPNFVIDLNFPMGMGPKSSEEPAPDKEGLTTAQEIVLDTVKGFLFERVNEAIELLGVVAGGMFEDAGGKISHLEDERLLHDLNEMVKDGLITQEGANAAWEEHMTGKKPDAPGKKRKEHPTVKE